MTSIATQATHTLYFQRWEESERGWGTRPDGATLHTTPEAAKRYKDDFWKRQKALLEEETPHEYTRTAGELEEIPCTQVTYEAVLAKENREEVAYQDSWTRPI